MWIITAFDLPMTSSAERKGYTVFRKHIMRLGFVALQKSIYARHCSSPSRAATFMAYVEERLPDKGEVMLFSMTQASFERQRFYENAARTIPPAPPEQFLIFENQPL